MNPRLTKMSLPNRGGISSEVFNLFCNQSLANLHYLYTRLWKQDQEIKTNLKMAIVGTKEKTPLSGDSSFYVDYIYLDGISSGEDPVVDPKPAVIWSFESESEASGFAEDGGSGAVPEYTEDQAFNGNGALKITPNGEALETKVKAVLPADYYENWQTCSKLVINLYMEEEMDPVINKIFIGMADVTGGEWSWVEGTLYSLTEATAGAWNTCEIPLPHKMVKIDPSKQYELSFGFFNEESGTEEKIEKYLKEDAFFYEDLNRIYNRGYILEQKANELLRSIQ